MTTPAERQRVLDTLGRTVGFPYRPYTPEEWNAAYQQEGISYDLLEPIPGMARSNDAADMDAALDNDLQEHPVRFRGRRALHTMRISSRRQGRMQQDLAAVAASGERNSMKGIMTHTELIIAESAARKRGDGAEGDRLQALRWERAMGSVINTENTQQGEQTIMPGAERSARQAAASRESAGHGKIRPRKPQKDPGGLFAPKEAAQPKLF